MQTCTQPLNRPISGVNLSLSLYIYIHLDYLQRCLREDGRKNGNLCTCSYRNITET